jgi:hypothetical protein
MDADKEGTVDCYLYITVILLPGGNKHVMEHKESLWRAISAALPKEPRETCSCCPSRGHNLKVRRTA